MDPVAIIREQDPLKQGLKLFSRAGEQINTYIREQDPLKQGLKLILSLSLFSTAGHS